MTCCKWKGKPVLLEEQWIQKQIAKTLLVTLACIIMLLLEMDHSFFYPNVLSNFPARSIGTQIK